jgi:hypothetical protein
MLNFYCPDFYNAQQAYALLFELKEKSGQCFYPNVNISTIYGNFPGCIWNGGGFSFNSVVDIRTMRDYFSWYQDKGVTLQLTFTNPVLEETDVYDRYGNAILDAAAEFDNIEILVVSPCLEKYIREKYPHIKIDKSIISTTRDRETSQDSLDGYLNILDNYNKCVLPRKYTKDRKFLDTIPQEYRNRFEILVTDPCPVYCPHLYEHYEEFGRMQLFQEPLNTNLGCQMISGDNPFRQWMYRAHQVQYDELTEFYDKEGFSEIKISGRGTYVFVVLQLVPYLIKPEYHLDVYKWLLDFYLDISVPPLFN